MSVKILNKFPPNYEEICRIITPPSNAIFAWYDTIYQPNKEEIPADIAYHESIHCQRQKKYPLPEIWWTKWIHSKEFRQEEEVIAFAAQLKFIKQYYPNRAVKEALSEMAENLSKNYKLNLTFHQAETIIRKYESR